MWHRSQEIVPMKPDGSVIEFQVRLCGLEVTTRWVLSWGRKAQVLGPRALEKRVRDELRAMASAADKV
jgi:predicted DNA-binding transcriptional regulator YafY